MTVYAVYVDYPDEAPYLMDLYLWYENAVDRKLELEQDFDEDNMWTVDIVAMRVL